MAALIECRDVTFELRAARYNANGAVQLVTLTHFNIVHKATTALNESQTCATINDEQYTLSKPAGPTGSNDSKPEEFNPATDLVAPFLGLCLSTSLVMSIVSNESSSNVPLMRERC